MTQTKLNLNNMETANLNQVQTKVIDSLIDQVLNNPTFSWEKMWNNMSNGSSPYNPISKTVYSGWNAFILGFYASVKGSNQFATFNQISGKKGMVNKGAKSIPITIFDKYILAENGKKYYKISDVPAGMTYEVKQFLKNFLVFSITDTNLTFEEPTKEIKNNPIAECQKIVNQWECKINIGLDNSRAFYAPMQDYINMPDLQAFKNANAFYTVAFHEIAHSTGAKNRLNRDLSGMFGNDKYAKEELIAELTSVLLGANFGILTDDLIKNSAAYLQSWTKRMMDKKNELFAGLNGAMKAYKYILEKVG